MPEPLCVTTAPHRRAVAADDGDGPSITGPTVICPSLKENTMKKLALCLVLSLGCSSFGEVMRVTADVGRTICGLAGCPCNGHAAPSGRGPIAYDIYPDGGVRAVYP